MKAFLLLVATGLAGSGIWAQSILSSVESGDSMRLLPYDAAVLDLGEPKNDLPCSLLAVKPELDFDFLFLTGYRVSIPLRELAGAGNRLTILFRAIPQRHPDQPIHFVQSFRVPAIKDGAEGKTVLEGEFLVGKGKYHVDWLARDEEGRTCARFWDLAAEARDDEGQWVKGIAEDVIRPVGGTPFQEDGPVVREPVDRLLHVKVIVNFAPQSPTGTNLGPKDLDGLVAILRKIGREPRIGSYSLVACSVPAQRVLYRQESAPRIDLSALGEALGRLSLAKVDVQQLAKNSETAFLSSLIAEEMAKERPDGLIFVGPKYPLDCDVPKEVMERLSGFDHPVFYLNYALDPLVFPWRDAIGKIVKQLHGLEYTITRPRDLWNAWADIVPRIVRAKKP